MAVISPALLTAVLALLGARQQRQYIFGYLALVAAAGMSRGMGPALIAAVLSFLLVDYFFVPPLGTLAIATGEDAINLIAFLITALVIGILSGQRHRARLASESMARQMRQVNSELVRLNKEQAEAAQASLRLARSEQQIRALQEADRLRRELLASVSHELRTPLGTILTESTDLLAATQPDSDQARQLGAVASQARRLRTMVDDMLDMARLESGALELDLGPVRLSDAIAAAVERLHVTSPDRTVGWDLASSNLTVLADWERLGQVLDNLLANADRFGPPGTVIGIGAGREAGGRVAVSIADSGPGVPTELRSRIFERFVRGPEPEGAGGGSGLGLSLARGLVEAHAGTLRLEESDQGAVFRFTLPEAPESAASPGA
jgi:K+-sensing histidine kinase KdpD